MTRYQWPRIIAVHAPPSRNAELEKLRIVMSSTAGPPFVTAIACAQSATAPAPTLTPEMYDRIDVSTRPIVSQENTTAASNATSAPNATLPAVPADDSGGRN